MPKGKPWTTKEEKQLRDMLQEGKRITEIAAAYGKSPSAVTQKMRRLGLEVVVLRNRAPTTTKDLPNVEEALEKLRDAIIALETPGLDQSETMGLGHEPRRNESSKIASRRRVIIEIN
jgi:hypothetical protein